MQKRLFVILIIILLIIGAYYLVTEKNKNKSDTQTPQEHKTQELQTFHGVLPCADCSGLDTTLALNPDNTYKLTEIYQGKNDDEPFITEGTWKNETSTPENPNQEVLALTAANGDISYYAWTNDNTLTNLDQDKNAIDAPFNLSLTRQ